MLALFCLSLHAAAAAVPATPDTMTAAYKDGFLPCLSPFKCVKTHSIKTPKPESGEVLIKVAASSVNPCDVDYLELGVGCSGGGGVLGMDVAGTVVEVGPGGDGRLKVGDRVWADTGAAKGDSGGMAQYAITQDKQTGIAPSSLNLTQAGTIPLAGCTALEMWDKVAQAFGGKIPSNLTMVVTSGTGGTGFIGLQLGKRVYGADTMITSTSGADDIALAKALGADVVVDYKDQDDVFEKLGDNSVDIVFDNFGEKGTADKAMRVLKSTGVYIILPGGGGGKISSHPKAGVKQINFGFTESDSHEPLDRLKVYFEAGQLKSHIFQQVPLEHASEAFQISKTGSVAGKVAVVVDAGQS